LKDSAYFFQGNYLLVPPGVPDAGIGREFPVELAREFDAFSNEQTSTGEHSHAGPPLVEIFQIPALTQYGGEAESGEAITAVSVDPCVPLPDGWRNIVVRQSLSLLGADGSEFKSPLSGIIRAFHIAQWRRDSRFCGSCGSINADAENETARKCPVCSRIEYPRVSPAIITVIVNDNGEILLAHNKNFAAGSYSHIAGFNEPGESLEATVHREIREEINIEVKDIRYLHSQPWPFPNSLMIGFYAKYASGVIRPDGVEIEDAKWFKRSELPKLPGTGSLSRHLINQWLDGEL
jgi:NAD+ diphosphatase